MTLLTDIPVTAAGENSWEWQLRDKNGRWIQMGSEVSFSHQGKMITGVIVGSPGPGKATIRLANGSTVTVPTAGVRRPGRVLRLRLTRLLAHRLRRHLQPRLLLPLSLDRSRLCPQTSPTSRSRRGWTDGAGGHR